MHHILNVYNDSVNLNLTVNRPQILFDLQTAEPFVYLAATSGMDMGLGGANICYLTQISAQCSDTERRQVEQDRATSFGFCSGLKRRKLQNYFWGQLLYLSSLKRGRSYRIQVIFQTGRQNVKLNSSFVHTVKVRHVKN